MPKRKILGWDSSSEEEDSNAIEVKTASSSDNVQNQLEESHQSKRFRALPSMSNAPSNSRKELVEPSSRRKSLGSARTVKWSVFVFVRGDVTQRVLSIWEEQFGKNLRDLGVEICKQLTDKVNVAVVATTVTHRAFRQWCESNASVPVNHLTIVNSQWLIDMITKRAEIPFDSYLVAPNDQEEHQSQLATQVDTNTFGESSLMATGGDIPRQQSVSSIHVGPSESEQAVVHQQQNQMFAKHYRGYACMKTGQIQQNYNKHITDILEDLQGIYELINDDWRAKGYKTCVGILKQLPPIRSIDDVRNVKGIGESIREKIEEILQTGSLKKLSYFKNDPIIAAITELAKIWGVGEKTAVKFIKQGYKSVADLRQRGSHILNAQQLIGLKHYEEFMVKIPRSEIEEILSFVQLHADAISPGAKCMICGSYRRGKPSSGDADVIISPPDGVEELSDDMLPSLIARLSSVGFLTDHLALPSHMSIDNNEKGIPSDPSRTPRKGSPETIPHSPEAETIRVGVRAKIRSFPLRRQGSSDTCTLVDSPDRHSLLLGDTQQTQNLSPVESPQPIRQLPSHISSSQMQRQYSAGAAESSHPFRSRTSYMGVCQLPGDGRLHRRIDIKVMRLLIVCTFILANVTILHNNYAGVSAQLTSLRNVVLYG